MDKRPNWEVYVIGAFNKGRIEDKKNSVILSLGIVDIYDYYQTISDLKEVLTGEGFNDFLEEGFQYLARKGYVSPAFVKGFFGLPPGIGLIFTINVIIAENNGFEVIAWGP